MGRNGPDKQGKIRGMDSNKTHSNVQSSRVFQLEGEIYGRRRLLRFKAVTENIVENALNTLDEICAEEIQGKNPLPSRLEKYFRLHHYLDYLKRLCEGRV